MTRNFDPDKQDRYGGTLKQLNGQRAKMGLPPVRSHQLDLVDPESVYVSTVDASAAMAVHSTTDNEQEHKH